VRRDILELDAVPEGAAPPPLVTLHDVDAVRLLLTGGSVVDWQRLSFRTLEEVDRFLAVHLLDVNTPEDMERIRYVFNEAVSYLEEQLHLHFPKDLRSPVDVRQVFLWASEHGRFRRTQILACVILKLMHIIHHMEAANLRFRLSLSEERILEGAHRRIAQQARSLQESGVPIAAFYGNRKPRSSIITKLAAKREAVAAPIFDKLRYRVVVFRHDQILPTLATFVRTVFPFNYTVPGQSHNNLVELDDLDQYLNPADLALDRERRSTGWQVRPLRPGGNEFSGSTYRVINWIVDYPVRIPPSAAPEGFSFEVGRVVYVNVEFQLLDQATALSNEQGENAHSLYKDRQHRQVAQRLKRGGMPSRTPR
jgi:uncharacterized protein (TIGR04552 family)